MFNVFVPYRGFYFLNCFERLWKQYPNKRFSSPIGAFIFLIEIAKDTRKEEQAVSFRPLSGLLFS